MSDPADQSTTIEGDVEGDVTVAPPPHTSTPPAEDGQPDGDVKPATDGDVDPQSSPQNQELQGAEEAEESAPDPG